jgi:hypothetical protein
MIGYKGFNKELQCIGGFQYEIGKTYVMPVEEVELGGSGFHFCRYPCDVFKYYDDIDDLYAEVEVKINGTIIEDSYQSVTNQIKIVKFLDNTQLFSLMPNQITRKNGTQEWYKNGRLHRLNGPALEHSDGTQEWYKNGRLHRLNGPALEHSDGSQEWYRNGNLHRLNGPAVTFADGSQFWYKKDRLHRLHGPAIILADGSKNWYVDGHLHRSGGPAIELSNGSQTWYKNGRLQRKKVNWTIGSFFRKTCTRL